MKIHADIDMPISALNVHHGDVRFFRLEVEMKQFRARALTNMQYNPNLSVSKSKNESSDVIVIS